MIHDRLAARGTRARPGAWSPILRHARRLIAAWRDDGFRRRRHSSLDGLARREYHQRSKEDQTLNGAAR